MRLFMYAAIFDCIIFVQFLTSPINPFDENSYRLLSYTLFRSNSLENQYLAAQIQLHAQIF